MEEYFSPLMLVQHLPHIEQKRLTFIGHEKLFQAFTDEKQSAVIALLERHEKTKNLKAFIELVSCLLISSPTSMFQQKYHFIVLCFIQHSNKIVLINIAYLRIFILVNSIHTKPIQ